MSVTDSPRILIARMSAVGDTILTLPVACALRRHFPGALIGWVVEKNASPIVVGHECLDQVIVLERGWFTSPSSILAARNELRPFGFEIAVDCQSVSKTSIACWVSGAKTRIGCRGKYGCEVSPWLNNQLIEPQQTHLTARSLELLTALGIQQASVEWKLPIDDQSRERMSLATAELGLQDGYAVINPGATWDSKRWEMDRFAAVAKHLASAHRLPTLVVWGGSRDRQWAEEIVQRSDGHAVLAPASSLIELAALIKRGRLFVSSDTGPLHMAVAVGTPSIGLYGATRPQDSGPYGDPHIAIQFRDLVGSRRQRRSADNACMRLITTEAVCEKCDELLAATSAAQSSSNAA